MGMKRASSLKKPALRWTVQDVTTLLSWLDHTLAHKELDFETTVVAIFKDSYTFAQIERKLERLWKAKGPNDVPGEPLKLWSDDIYTLGSQSLHTPHGLTDEEKKEIRLALDELETQWIVKQLEAESPHSRRLRSHSRVDSSPSLPISKTATPNLAPGRTLQNRRFFAPSVTPSTVKREIRDTESSTNERSIGRKRLKTYGKRSRSTLSTPPSNPKTTNKLAAERTRGSKVVVDSEAASDTLDEQDTGGDYTPQGKGPAYENEHGKSLGCAASSSQQPETRDKGTVSFVCSATEELSRQIQCSKCQTLQHEDHVKILCGQCIPKPMLQEHATTQIDDNDSSVLSYSNTALDGAKLEIDFLRELLKEKENDLQEEKTEVIQLQKEKGWLHLAQNDRDSQEGIPVGETLRKLHQKIHELNAELDTRKALGTFTKLSSTSRQQFYGKFASELRQAYALSQQMLAQHGNDEPLLQPPLQRYPELKAIVLRLFGVDNDGETALERAAEQLSKLSAQAAVRAITTCALQNWVYDTDFPSDEFGSSRILENYRACILKQDGALAVRNLDLAALQSFIQTDSFQHNLVTNKAAKLAIRLSQALAPFFSDTPNALSEKGSDGFSTWRENTEDWKTRQNRMTDMFRCALIAKAGSCLNLEKYEMLIHAPGTRFDKSSMSVETMEGMPDSRNHQGRFVQLCIEPAVYSYMREEVLETPSISETGLSAQNFMLRDEGQRGKGNALVKAVVILSEVE